MSESYVQTRYRLTPPTNVRAYAYSRGNNEGLFDRTPELKVVLLEMLSHSKLTHIPEDFICGDRKSLVCVCVCVLAKGHV